MVKCGDKKCKCCLNIVETDHVNFTNGMHFKIRCEMSCSSCYVIYVITCKGCKRQYIGETGDILRNRVSVHRQLIKDSGTRQIPLSEHIDNCSTEEIQFSICPFYKLHNSDTILRREKEKYFIKLFKPLLNK